MGMRSGNLGFSYMPQIPEQLLLKVCLITIHPGAPLHLKAKAALEAFQKRK